ncbi:unnamed protein product [Ranitomeya imitator]|uniref:PX domain-containing protein n=1 Tax=Ranitomeya imitator TaxID=111125 RepID=A0ABN9KQP4_9NEOB|nr:unnamed protein product [Ranitomeya imitator]
MSQIMSGFRKEKEKADITYLSDQNSLWNESAHAPAILEDGGAQERRRTVPGRPDFSFSIYTKMKESSSRHPVNVEAIGLMQHGNDKTYMFSVSWSDHNKVLIYRTFQEFKKFQRDLKKKFPLEAGALNKRERTLPKLQDAPRTVTKRNVSKRFLERLRLLEAYSHSLLKMDAKISQSDIVVQFFTLQHCDLKPSFPEDR